MSSHTMHEPARFGNLRAVSLLIALVVGMGGCLKDVGTSCCDTNDPGSASATSSKVAPAEPAEVLAIPDVSLKDQDGRSVRFFSDLVKGKVVAVSFVFTTCTTVCPLIGAKFSEVQRKLGDRLGPDFRLISVSVDPANDSPARLKAWGKTYGAGPEWKFVTGDKSEVDRLLKALGSFSGDKRDHSPSVLIIDGDLETGRRTGAQAGPSLIAKMMKEALAARPAPPEERPAAETPALVSNHDAARRYFTDTILIDSAGRELRFYSDLIEGKVVVINVFFSTCKGSCPVMAATLAKLQDRLADHVGKDLNVISISVDPANDTPDRLKSYARGTNARPGWYFLTGSKENVAIVLRKLGQFVDHREDHSPIMLVGNDRSGLWKKGFGLAKTDEIIALVRSVLGDKGP
jgi:protein SCO1/2